VGLVVVMFLLPLLLPLLHLPSRPAAQAGGATKHFTVARCRYSASAAQCRAVPCRPTP
jgi:hypothetical protein